MKKLWLLTLGAFAFQLAIFFGSLPFLAEQGKYGVAIALASAGTIFVMLGALISVFITPYRFSAMFAFVGLAAFTGTLALALAMANPDMVSAASAFVGLCVVAFMMAFLATFPAMNDDPDKPRWALLVAALPLGIGAIVGGILLLVFTRKEKVDGGHSAIPGRHKVRWVEPKRHEGPVIPHPGNDTPSSE